MNVVRATATVLLLSALTACSASGGGGGGSGITFDDAGSGGTSGSSLRARCANLCARATGPNCPGPSTCESTCAQGTLPDPACNPQFAALFDCIAGQPVVCESGSITPPEACSPLFNALLSCTVRARDAGRPTPAPLPDAGAR